MFYIKNLLKYNILKCEIFLSLSIYIITNFLKKVKKDRLTDTFGNFCPGGGGGIFGNRKKLERDIGKMWAESARNAPKIHRHRSNVV